MVLAKARRQAAAQALRRLRDADGHHVVLGALERERVLNKQKMGVVFERTGSANWRMTEIRLPATPGRWG